MAYTGTSVAGGENNTTFNATNVEFVGKDLEFFTVTFPSTVAAKTAKDSTQYTVELTIQKYANILGAGPLINSGQEKTYMVEATDALVGSAASAGGSFTLTTTTAGSSLATLQTAIQALGVVDSINMGSQTATASKLGILNANVVS